MQDLAPTYVEATPSREVMFRIPPLQNMQSSSSTEQSWWGDVSVSSSSYERPSFGYTPVTNTLGLGLGMRNGIVSQANFNTTPVISTVIRNNTSETSRNLSSDHDRWESLTSRGLSRSNGDHSNYAKGMKPGTYDGAGSWSDYLIQFHLIADYYRLSIYEKAPQLATHLRGTAQGV